MTKKYYNHKLQTNPPRRQEVPRNTIGHKTSDRQQSKAREMIAKLKRALSFALQNLDLS